MKSNWIVRVLGLLLGTAAGVVSAQQGWDAPQQFGSYQPATNFREQGPGYGTNNNARRIPRYSPASYDQGPSASDFHGPPLNQEGPVHPDHPGSGGFGGYPTHPPVHAGGYPDSGNCAPCNQGQPGSGYVVGNHSQFSNSGQGCRDFSQGGGGCGNGGGWNSGANGYGGYDGGYGEQGGYYGDDCGAPVGNRYYGDYGRGGSRFLGGMRGNRGGNWIVGANALIFHRDLEDDLGLGFNAGSDYLFSTDSAPGTMGGVEAMLGRRGCSGWGWEARYWGLYPGQSDVTFGNMPGTTLSGLTDVFYVPAGTSVLNIYNTAATHRLYRDNDFTNVEINVLRNGGTFGNCGQNSFELFSGFRWFQFDESLRYAAFSANPAYPAQLNYDSSVANRLLGIQSGGRFERCLSNRLRFTSGIGLGLFNNNISHHQRISDQATGTDATVWAGPFAGQMFDYNSRKNDIAMLGELNAGIYYSLTCNLRLSLGYRAIGISGVALAPDQIPYNFRDVVDVQRIDSNGSLILHGAYAGVQACF